MPNLVEDDLAVKLIGNCITDEDARSKTRQASGSYEGLPTTAKKQKLKWHGHVNKKSLPNLSYMALYREGEGEADREREGGKNISEWTCLKLSNALREAETRE